MLDGSSTELIIPGIPKKTAELKLEGKEVDGEKSNPLAYAQMRMGTVVHSIIEGLFNPAYGNDGKAFNRYEKILMDTAADPEKKEIIEMAFGKIQMSAKQLKENIEANLPEGKNHYVFVETPFQNDQAITTQLLDAIEKGKYDGIVQRSGYDSIAQMVKIILTRPDQGVNLDGEKYSIEQMVLIATGEMSIEDKDKEGLIKDLLALSTYGYFLSRSGVAYSLIASAVARSDLFFLSADSDSEADTFLRERVNKMFGTNMHDLVGLLGKGKAANAENENDYLKLVEYLLRGDITITLVDIKISTINQIDTNEGLRRTRFEVDQKKIDEMYGWDLSHTFQAMLQSFMGISRVLTNPAGVEMSNLLDVGNVFDEGGLENLIKYLRILMRQRFVIARMYYPILNKLDKSSPVCELDYDQMQREEPLVATTRLDIIGSIWKRLTRFYGYIKKRAEEEEEEKNRRNNS